MRAMKVALYSISFCKGFEKDPTRPLMWFQHWNNIVAQIQARVVRNPANKVLWVPGGEGEVVYEDDP